MPVDDAGYCRWGLTVPLLLLASLRTVESQLPYGGISGAFVPCYEAECSGSYIVAQQCCQQHGLCCGSPYPVEPPVVAEKPKPVICGYYSYQCRSEKDCQNGQQCLKSTSPSPASQCCV